MIPKEKPDLQPGFTGPVSPGFAMLERDIMRAECKLPGCRLSGELRKRIFVSLLFVLLFGLSLAGYKYNSTYLIYDWALADIGQTYMSALHLLEGQVPYRDFPYQWGPYSLYLTAYILKLFGIKISSIKLAMTLVVIATTGVTYLLGREFLPRFHAFFAALIIHIIFIQNTLVPYANIFVVPVGLTALLLIVKYRQKRKEYFVLLAGFLCGIALGLKFSAGSFVCVGIVVGLMAIGEQHGESGDEPRRKVTAFNVRTIMPVALILGLIVLISQHLSMKYFFLFILPVVIACFAAARLQGRSQGRVEPPEKRPALLRGSLLRLTLGTLAGSAPWMGFYFIKLDGSKFFYYLIGAPLEYSKHIFLPYYEMEKLTGYFFIYTAICISILWLMHKASFQKHAWLATLIIMGGYVCLFRDMGVFALARSIYNITYFLAPITSIAFGLVVLAGSKPKPGRNMALVEDAGIIVILLYHVFFFFVAYPHTEATHLSWSYPTSMILLFHLLLKAQRYIVSIWPESTRNSAGRIAAATLALFLPALVLLNQTFWILICFYDISPDLRNWSKREYVKLENERAGIYEFLGSAYQIEFVDRVIQASTDENEYIFEFPTAFFYFYSQRKNPSRWNYFYPGLFSDKQLEIISDLERTKPRFAIIYDNPDAFLFSYSKDEINDNFKELIAYINAHYRKYHGTGYFTILERI